MIKQTIATLMGMSIIALGLPAAPAADPVEYRVSRSTEGIATSDATTPPIDKNSATWSVPLVTQGSRTTPEGRPDKMATIAYTTSDFMIFDADTLLTGDWDRDGYFTRLEVNFDADVSTTDAWVYARMFLSYEGGPWNHYFTTDIFKIYGTEPDDRYQVITDLIEGYPSGYYDVLIELYDADTDRFVAEYGPYEDHALYALPLEDEWRDGGDDHYHGGGGAFTPLGLGLLLIAAVIRRRVLGTSRNHA